LKKLNTIAIAFFIGELGRTSDQCIGFYVSNQIQILNWRHHLFFVRISIKGRPPDPVEKKVRWNKSYSNR